MIALTAEGPAAPSGEIGASGECGALRAVATYCRSAREAFAAREIAAASCHPPTSHTHAGSAAGPSCAISVVYYEYKEAGEDETAGGTYYLR